jgi:hypothetical protein
VVTNVTEVQGMEGDVILLQEIFHYRTGVAVNGMPGGELRPTGLRPKFLDKLTEAGIEVPAKAFQSVRPTTVAPAHMTRSARRAAVPEAAALVAPERSR